MPHREGIREYLAKADLSGKNVIDWGCGTKPIKNYLPGADHYFGVDILMHVGADLVADICEPLKLPMSYDAAFCLEVLEHVKYPMNALENIFNHLDEGGVLYFSVPFLYPVHSDHDLWRYTDQGLHFMLGEAGFKNIEVKPTTFDKQGWVGKAEK